MFKKVMIATFLICLCAGSAMAYTCDFTAKPVVGWVPLKVTFTPTNNVPDNVLKDHCFYFWDIQMENGIYSYGEDDSQRSPKYQVTFTAPGVYDAIYKVKKLSNEKTHSILIPIASVEKYGYIKAYACDFIADRTLINKNNFVNFYNVGDIVGSQKYIWNFGDGYTYSGFSTTHQYKHIGKYTVTMTVKDSIIGANTIKKIKYITVV